MRLAIAIALTTAGVLLAVGILRGFGGSGDDTDLGDGSSAGGVRVDGAAAEVVLRPRSPHGFTTVPVVEELPERAVLRIRVVGFEEYEQATARQCRADAAGTTCGNGLPVQFGPYGTAVFQYLVTEAFGADSNEASTCGPEQPPCLVVITSLDGRRRAELQTVFGGRLPPPGQARIEPAGRLHHGDVVTVTVEHLPPGTSVTVTTCVAPSTSDERRCGDPAPTASLTVGADGSGQARVAVTRGPIGEHGLRCDDDVCAIVAIADRADVRVEPVPIAFAALPGAEYDIVRLTAGLLAAAGLFGAALWLVRRTDWSPVGEAAAPEIDEAAYADLDAIVAALPPEDREEATDSAVGSGR